MDNDGAVRGLALDIVFEDIDGELDDNFDEEFHEALKEVTDVKILECTQCTKTYKTQGGLRRHQRAKHSIGGNIAPITEEKLEELFNVVQEKVANDGNYFSDMHAEVRNTQLNSSVLKLDIEGIYNELVEGHNANKFISHYYATIVQFAEKYIEGGWSASRIIMKKLGDKIVATASISKEPQNPKNIPDITTDELEGLQYLGGYVVHKFKRKLWNFENTKGIKYLDIILNMSATENIEDSYVASQSRGGLTHITPDAQKLFVKAEKIFRERTTADNLRKIGTQQMVFDLVMDSQVISIYDQISDGISIEDELKYSLLAKVFSLYLRVRAFSFAKDMTYKYQLENKSSKKKALRQDLKTN